VYPYPVYLYRYPVYLYQYPVYLHLYLVYLYFVTTKHYPDKLDILRIIFNHSRYIDKISMIQIMIVIKYLGISQTLSLSCGG